MLVLNGTEWYSVANVKSSSREREPGWHVYGRRTTGTIDTVQLRGTRSVEARPRPRSQPLRPGADAPTDAVAVRRPGHPERS